jgi:hypothetical protein
VGRREQCKPRNAAALIPAKSLTFEKRLANHANALALHFLNYNFVRTHKTLGTAPAVAAGIASRRWKITDIVGVFEAWEASGEG